LSVKLNYTAAALRVCVDRNENGHLIGRVVSQRLSQPIHFSDVAHLILQVDAVLDEQKFPQAFQRIRTLSPAAAPEVPAAQRKEEMLSQQEVEGAEGALGTFQIHITTRQHASWQGFADWLDGSPRQNFESTLELIKFIAARYCAE